MKKKIKLYPNCSEIIWRLNITRSAKEEVLARLKNEGGETEETDTSTFPNSCLDRMIDLMKDVRKEEIDDVVFEEIDNSGGGGSVEYVEKCFEIAKDFCKGKITREEAEKKDDEDWG